MAPPDYGLAAMFAGCSLLAAFGAVFGLRRGYLHSEGRRVDEGTIGFEIMLFSLVALALYLAVGCAHWLGLAQDPNDMLRGMAASLGLAR